MEITPTLALGRSGRWEIRYSEKLADGSWRTRTVSTRTADRDEAERFLSGWHSAYQQTATQSPHTIQDLIDDYLDDVRARGGTRSQEDALVVVGRHLGHLTPAQLTRQELERYRQQRTSCQTGAPVAANTLRRDLITLGTALRHAVKTGVLQPEEVPYISLPAAPAGRAVWLDVPQEARLLELAAQTSVGEPRLTRIHRFVWLALCTGARLSAMRELRWDQVDLGQGVIDYRNQRRTKKRRVPVPISDRLRPVLEQASRERQGPYVLDHTRRLYNEWERLIEGTEFQGLHIHDLRRTFATLLAQAGVDMWQIAGLLGDTLNVVTQHYAHHAPGYLRDAINRRAA